MWTYMRILRARTDADMYTHICNFHESLCACLYAVFFFLSLIYPLPYLASPCLAILILYSHVSLMLFVSIYTSEREY